jgi:hypothetical protein
MHMHILARKPLPIKIPVSPSLNSNVTGIACAYLYTHIQNVYKIRSLVFIQRQWYDR